MRGGIHIGRIFGINIRIDWSWLLIFLLVAWNLGALLSSTHPGWSATLTWSTAVIAALLFFASVLAHELAHSLVARAQGVPVRNITLFLFGGVSNIQREPKSPGDEFWMAIVGPLTSIVLGVLLTLGVSGGLAVIGPMAFGETFPANVIARLSPVVILLLWLGSINVIVGLFNLIPGFPLDGGRVLRSILWAASGNLRRATRWASWVGQGIAWLMIFIGISMVFGVRVPFFGTGLVGGVWLGFIGWFLNSASAQSYEQIVIQDVLQDVPVAAIMRRDPSAVPPGETVAALVHDYVMQSDDHTFPVMDDGRLLGMVSFRDVRKIDRKTWDETLVSSIMTPEDHLVTVAPNENAATALEELTRNDVGQLPVMDEGRFVGLLRRQDIMKWLQLHSDLRRN